MKAEFCRREEKGISVYFKEFPFDHNALIDRHHTVVIDGEDLLVKCGEFSFIVPSSLLPHFSESGEVEVYRNNEENIYIMERVASLLVEKEQISDALATMRYVKRTAS